MDALELAKGRRGGRESTVVSGPAAPRLNWLLGAALSTIGMAGLVSSPANAKTFYFHNVIYDYDINQGSVRDTVYCPSMGGCTPTQQMRISGSFDFTGDAANGVAQFQNVSVTFTLADYIISQKQNGEQQSFTYTAGATNQFDSTSNWTTISFYDPNNIKGGKSDSGVNLTISGSLSGLATTSADFGVNIGNGTANDNFCNSINTTSLQCTSQKNNLTVLSGSLVDTIPVPSPSIAFGIIPFAALSAKRIRRRQLRTRLHN